MTRILVAGGAGQLGAWIAYHGAHDPGAVVTALGREDLNIVDEISVSRALTAYQPDMVINCAAYTNVDEAEMCPEYARSVNVCGAEALAVACAKRGVKLVQISTDFVFGVSEDRHSPYLPTDRAEPLSVYGETKREGEKRVLAAHRSSLVVRTSWLYSGPARVKCGHEGEDFVTTMLRLKQNGTDMTVVSDQIGSPTFASDLALALLETVTRPDVFSAQILHYSGLGAVSWFDLAVAACTAAGWDASAIRPCGTTDFPRPAPRPQYSALDSSGWAEAGFTPAKPWEDAIVRACSLARS